MQKNDTQEPSFTTVEEGTLLDYITNTPVAENAKEQVRQRLARALFHEYGISVDDMEPDFRLKIDGRSKKVDIAIFAPGSKHTQENVRRIVICQKEPPSGTRSAYKMRDHKQAEKELALLKAAMIAAEGCRYGLWSNGLALFDDLPKIADAYREFLQQHRESGA